MIQPRNLARKANANWVFYDNSGVAAFTINVSTGAITIPGVTSFADGTVALPGITFGADLDSGLYRIGANNVGIAVNAAKVVDIGTAGVAITGTLSSTGILSCTGAFRPAGRIVEKMTATTDTTAGALTITAAMLAGGILVRDPNGGNRTDVLDTAAAIIAGTPALSADGDTLACWLINTADAAETITLGGAPAGVTYVNAGQTIAQNESALVLIQRTGATTVSVYIVGA